MRILRWLHFKNYGIRRVLTAYFDDSGTHGHANVVLVAGIFGTEWQLTSLDRIWTLGGDTLTDEASTIKEQKGCSEQLMFLDAQGDKDLVWTRESQSRVQVKSTLSFIGLIAFGTCALASASMLVALFV